MHELSICYSLLQQLESIAAERNASAVERVYLKIGPLSGIEPKLLQRAYPLAAAGTIAEDAELVFDTADVVVTCTQCGAESKVLPNRLLCSDCGDFRTRVVSGDEMILQRLELTTVH
jgi:hydrogenase nickel incorporation protein HypA/HybF